MKRDYKFGILFFAICISASFSSFAQAPFVYWDSVPVIQWGDTIKYPFAGGFNNPQFSSIDLNGDGIMDLFVFDRSTNRTYTFINKGTPGKPSYFYEPQYRKCFPPELTDWVLLRDYNCDGKNDIFTSRNTSFAVYRNDYTDSTGLKFTFVKAFDQNFCYIVPADIPAICDVDNDGDIDILTFDYLGEDMKYFKNLRVDSGWSCDSIVYIQEEQCWGSFQEAFGSCTITLGDDSLPCKIHDRLMSPQEQLNIESGSLHPGNTTLALDLNGDGKKDLIIGPQICANAFMLTDSSAVVPSIDSVVHQTSSYPDTINPIYFFGKFPGTYYEDVNNDGLKDLIASPNRSQSEDTASVWLYKNTGDTLIPKFTFQEQVFLQGDMIDVGEGANPVFFDYNQDSLLDLVIGDFDYFTPSAPLSGPCGLALYENIGTKHSPAFKLITRDFANLMQYNLNGLYPAFGDLNGDGVQDMIVGESNGQLLYFTNTAGKGNPANFVLASFKVDSIDVGQFATPQLVDINCDGKLDLLVGNGLGSGNIKYYENVGTTTQPVFKKVSDKFGGIDVSVCCSEYAVPFFTTDSIGNFQLLVGTTSDSIYCYTNMDNDINGTFTLTDMKYSGINEGTHATVNGADLDNDGKMDLVVGNYAGGVALFKGTEKRVPWSCPAPPLPFSIKAYPNPVLQSGALTIHIDGLDATDYAVVDIYNVLGQKVYHDQPSAIANNWNISIPAYNLAAGLYFLKASVPSRNVGSYSLKFLVLSN